jgi:hypothetical protein
VGSPEGKRQIGRPRCRWENNIKVDDQDVVCEGMEWKKLAKDRDRWLSVLNAGNTLSC